jgi:hypothetical protein
VSFRHCASLDTVRYLNLGLRFLLELGALAALAWWGFRVQGVILGICLPLLAAVIWSLFVAPKARFPVALTIRAPIEMAIFVAAVLGLWGVGHGALAVVFGCAAAASELLLYTLGDPLAGERRV